MSLEDLETKNKEYRKDILLMTYDAGSGHPGGSMSMIDFVSVLYNRHMNISPETTEDPNRDVFILSKGHCAPGLYSVLADHGYFDRVEFQRLRRLGGLLQGHVDRKIPGIEMSTGSLGMGLGFGNGIALAKRNLGLEGRVYVVLGDGELQEGNIWESAMTSVHYKLDNVCVVVDHNRLQIDGFCEEVKGVASVTAKFEAFGFHVLDVDGHDLAALDKAIEDAGAHKGQPTCIVINTEKGHGVSFMANKGEFHGRALKDDEMVQAMGELGFEWSKETHAEVIA